jgi:hypothetical protein
MTLLNSDFNINILLENFLFLVVATSFFVIVGWAWSHSQPFDLPQPLPGWFKVWVLTVQVVGGVLPVDLEIRVP